MEGRSRPRRRGTRAPAAGVKVFARARGRAHRIRRPGLSRAHGPRARFQTGQGIIDGPWIRGATGLAQGPSPTPRSATVEVPRDEGREAQDGGEVSEWGPAEAGEASTSAAAANIAMRPQGRTSTADARDQLGIGHRRPKDSRVDGSGTRPSPTPRSATREVTRGMSRAAEGGAGEQGAGEPPPGAFPEVAAREHRGHPARRMNGRVVLRTACSQARNRTDTPLPFWRGVEPPATPGAPAKRAALQLGPQRTSALSAPGTLLGPAPTHPPAGPLRTSCRGPRPDEHDGRTSLARDKRHRRPKDSRGAGGSRGPRAPGRTTVQTLPPTILARHRVQGHPGGSSETSGIAACSETGKRREHARDPAGAGDASTSEATANVVMRPEAGQRRRTQAPLGIRPRRPEDSRGDGMVHGQSRRPSPATREVPRDKSRAAVDGGRGGRGRNVAPPGGSGRGASWVPTHRQAERGVLRPACSEEHDRTGTLPYLSIRIQGFTDQTHPDSRLACPFGAAPCERGPRTARVAASRPASGKALRTLVCSPRAGGARPLAKRTARACMASARGWHRHFDAGRFSNACNSRTI